MVFFILIIMLVITNIFICFCLLYQIFFVSLLSQTIKSYTTMKKVPYNIFLKLSMEFVDQEHGALNFTSMGLLSLETIFN